MGEGQEACQRNEKRQNCNRDRLAGGERLNARGHAGASVEPELFSTSVRQAAPFSQNSRASCRERESAGAGTSIFTASGAREQKRPASPTTTRRAPPSTTTR